MGRVGWAALCAAAAMMLGVQARADTFTLSNTSHPDCQAEFPGIGDAFDCSTLAGNGTAAPIPGGFLMVGPDLFIFNGPVTPNTTRLTAIADSHKTLTFDWDYVSFDDLTSFFDPAGFFINGVDTQLTTTIPHFVHALGTVTFDVSAGDAYGFYVHSGDSTSGPGVLSFSLVSSAPIGGGSAAPEASTWALMLLGLASVGAMLRARTSRLA